MQKLFWYNGNLIEKETLELAIDDPGLIYGATIFTTLRIYGHLDHPLTYWTGHCDRLRSTLSTFGWQTPDWNRIRQGAEALMTSFPVLRIVLFADGREWITGRFLPPDLIQRQQQGITAWLADESHFRRSLPDHKTGNYLAAWLALQKSFQLGAQEGILIDAPGNWLETCTGNLWGWRDGQWWTPPLDAGILPGLLRSQLIEWLQRHNEAVGEVPWDTDWVKGLEAIAYTNSVMELVPIRALINQQTTLAYNPSHPSLEQLRSLFLQD